MILGYWEGGVLCFGIGMIAFFHTEVILLHLLDWLYRLASLILLRSYAAQGCGVASLAESATVPLIQCALPVRVGIRNLFMVPPIGHPIFAKDTVGSLTYTDQCRKMRRSFNVH